MKNMDKLLFLFAAIVVVLLGIAVLFPRVYFWIYFVIACSVIMVVLAVLLLLIRKKQYRNGKIYMGILAIIAVVGMGIFLSPKNVLKLNFYLHEDALTQEVQNIMETITEQTPEGWGHSQWIPTIWKMENRHGISYKKEGNLVTMWINGITGAGRSYCITYLSSPEAEQLARRESIDFEWIEDGVCAYTTIR